MKHAVTLSLLALLCSCATQQIRVPVMKPAPVDLVHFQQIAVDRFDGEGCEQFSAQLAAALGTAVNPLTGKQGFTVLHRQDVDRALDQLRDRRGEQWDQRTMQMLDQWRTAAVALNGRMQQHDVQEQIVEQQDKDQQGHVHVRRTRVLTATVRVELEARDLGQDRVLDCVTLTATRTGSCQLDRDPHASPDPLPLLAAARGEIVQRYLDRVLPHQEWVAVELYKDDDYPDLQLGNGYAEVGNWGEAAAAYQRALQAMDAERRHMGLFNFGVACEFSDRFAEAKQALQEAYALGREAMILRELQRAEAREQEVQRLRAQSTPALPQR